nr:zona pellucida-binding protein, AWN-1=C4 fragment [swine, sperm, Peptide Partial, 7 aa] [Sus scrofa]
RSSSNIA